MVGPATLRRVDVGLLALACLLTLGLHWRAFFSEPLAIDEHVSYWISARSSPSTLLTRSLQYSATPPLFFALQRFSLAACGEQEWAMRLPAALCMLGALFGVWWIGRRSLSPPAGGIAAAFLAIHPAILPYSVVGRPYTLGILLSVLALHITGRFCGSPNRLHTVALAVVNLAIVQTHYLFAAVWLSEFIWLAYSWYRGRIGRRNMMVWFGAIALCTLSAIPGALHVWENRNYLNWTTRRPEFSDLLSILVPFQWPSWAHPLVWSLAIIPLLWQLALGRFTPMTWFDDERWRTSSPYLGSCIVWSIVPTAGLWLVGHYWLASLSAERYLIIFAPVAAVIAAGLCTLLRGVIAPLLCLAVCICWSGTLERIYRETARPARSIAAAESSPLSGFGSSSGERWKAAAEIIGNRDSNTGLVIVGSGLTEMSMVPLQLHDAVFHDYVSCRLGRMYLKGSTRRISLPMFWPPALQRDLFDFYRSQVLQACGGNSAIDGSNDDHGKSFWLIAATDTDLLGASSSQARAMLESFGAVQLWSGALDGIDVRQYRCPED